MSKVVDAVKRFVVSDVFERAFKTFVQTFVATWFLLEEPFSVEAVVAAVAAAISAVWNVGKAKLATKK